MFSKLSNWWRGLFPAEPRRLNCEQQVLPGAALHAINAVRARQARRLLRSVPRLMQAAQAEADRAARTAAIDPPRPVDDYGPHGWIAVNGPRRVEALVANCQVDPDTRRLLLANVWSEAGVGLAINAQGQLVWRVVLGAAEKPVHV